MCDHPYLRPYAPSGDVEHVHQLSENIGGLFENSDYSDITFLVDRIRFHAHKVIMASRSEYFRAMLYGGMRESGPGVGDIELKETSAAGFRVLLKYIYTGRVLLSELKEELVLEVLGLAHRYGFSALQDAISDFLQVTLGAGNVCLVFDIASVYSLRPLADTCLQFMDQHAPDILATDGFHALSQNALLEVLERDSFCAKEVDVFRAVVRWAERNTEAELAPVMNKVRLSLMKREELLRDVRASGLVPSDVILDAIDTQDNSRPSRLSHRGLKLAEENVACVKHHALVQHGEMKTALLDGDTKNYDLDRGFSRHPIDDGDGTGIVIELAHPYIINHIKMLLWDKDMRSYSYYMEVSTDEKDWLRVVDHTKYLCRSWQRLFFQPRVVKYIRVVGTHNTVNRVFHVVSFEAMFTKQPFTLENGIVVPRCNVARVEMNACVIEGVSRSRNALINGDTRNYDWDSGYTCHQLGSGAITVQLAQPYLISNLRLHLWDCDERAYGFYVETSTDQVNWRMAADRRNAESRAWQSIDIERRPVTFIRIIGTHNTANEVFHVVHFECPGEVTSPPASPTTSQAEGGSSPVTSGDSPAQPAQPQEAAKADEAEERAGEEARFNPPAPPAAEGGGASPADPPPPALTPFPFDPQGSSSREGAGSSDG